MVQLKREPWLMLLPLLMLASSAFHLEAISKGKSVQIGRLVVSSSRTTNETKDGVVKLHDEHAGDTNGYQSDQPELREWSQLAKLRLQRLHPSVQCDDDSMTLCIQGSQVPDFLVETNEKNPVPFSRMPSHCGFSMKRARRDVLLTAKYDGCNVVRQGSAYVLPLRVLGVAVEMVCPVARPVTMVSCNPTAMVVDLGVSPDAVRLKVNGSWQPVYQASCGFTLEAVGGGLTLTAPYTSSCWQFKDAKMLLSVQYMDVVLTLSCPAVQLPTINLPATKQPGTRPASPVTTSATTVAPASDDQQAVPRWLHAMPYPYGVPWHFHHGKPGIPPVIPTTNAPATTATTVAPASADQQAVPRWLHAMPYPYGVPWHFHHGKPGIPPVIPTTNAPATTVAPASADQQAVPRWLNAMPYPYDVPWHFYHGKPGIPPVIPTTNAPATTATSATTVAPASADQQAVPRWLHAMPYPYGVPWHFHHGKPSVPPTTTVPPTTPTSTVAPASADQQALYSWLPGPYNPDYGMPLYFPHGLPGSLPVPPSTTVAPSSADAPYLYPWLPAMYDPYSPMSSPHVPVSGSNSGDEQMYQMPWINPAYFSPLQVKGPGK